MRITNIEGMYVFKADLCIMKRFTVIRESFSQITRKVFFFFFLIQTIPFKDAGCRRYFHSTLALSLLC